MAFFAQQKVSHSLYGKGRVMIIDIDGSVHVDFENTTKWLKVPATELTAFVVLAPNPPKETVKSLPLAPNAESVFASHIS
jgi:hypothetical protein